MPGWMGLRGLEPQTPRDMQRERRREQRASGRFDAERRSMEKVQEILRDQSGDMTAFNKGIREEPFADCSSIGLQKVESIMSAKVAALSFDDNLLTVHGIFASVKFRHLPVVDEEGSIIGIISEKDFLRVVSPFFETINEQNRDRDIMGRKVGTIMTRHPICTGLETTVEEAVRLMNDRKISCLPVVEPHTYKLLGIVTWKDVVRAYCPGGFNLERESMRLKSGVRINPQTAENARLKARSAESVRLKARAAYESLEDAMEKQALPSRPRYHRTPDRILPEPELLVGQQEELRPRTAGVAGRELAAAQMERMHDKEGEDTGRIRLLGKGLEDAESLEE